VFRAPGAACASSAIGAFGDARRGFESTRRFFACISALLVAAEMLLLLVVVVAVLEGVDVVCDDADVGVDAIALFVVVAVVVVVVVGVAALRLPLLRDVVAVDDVIGGADALVFVVVDVVLLFVPPRVTEKSGMSGQGATAENVLPKKSNFFFCVSTLRAKKK
jgi:hypothetical protein